MTVAVCASGFASTSMTLGDATTPPRPHSSKRPLHPRHLENSSGYFLGRSPPQFVAMALIIGVPLLLLGMAMVLDRYPSWLGWTRLVIGAVTVLAAVELSSSPACFQASSCTGARLGSRAALAGGDGDRDCATCSRSAGRGREHITGRRRPPPRWRSELLLPPVVTLSASIRLAAPRADLRLSLLPMVARLVTPLPMSRTGFVGVSDPENSSLAASRIRALAVRSLIARDSAQRGAAAAGLLNTEVPRAGPRRTRRHRVRSTTVRQENLSMELPVLLQGSFSVQHPVKVGGHARHQLPPGDDSEAEIFVAEGTGQLSQLRHGRERMHSSADRIRQVPAADLSIHALVDRDMVPSPTKKSSPSRTPPKPNPSDKDASSSSFAAIGEPDYTSDRRGFVASDGRSSAPCSTTRAATSWALNLAIIVNVPTWA